ncbi:MAG: DNA polymerase III subunit alpha [Candidatus Brocadiae bacterium]|nr:DNA polymerase III subunit alpha [Candidatus Brocadiia bacterium]
MAFAHLHCHSTYSLLDGLARIDDLVHAAKAAGQTAIALTDHGNVFGAVEFTKRAAAAGVKPILGYEAYVAPGKMTEREKRNDKASYHLTMLVRNQKGWQNLVKLSSLAYQKGFYYKPRIDKETLAAHAEGLIGFSGCPNSESSTLVRAGQEEMALKVCAEYRDIFGKDSFFLEIQDHGMDFERQIAASMAKFSGKLGVPLVATNDVHYVRREDAQAQDVLICIGTNRTVNDEGRMRMNTDALYLRTEAEMRDLFRDYPGAVDITGEIASRCGVEFDFKSRHLPKFPIPEGHTPASYLRHLCGEGIRRRYPEVTEAIRQRLDFEIQTIDSMGFPGYFLIVWDFIHYAKTHGIPVGPGRGSAAGSLVSYALGITELDPLKYDLLFERFLNPGRNELPDIDVDLCQAGRERVLEYVRRKYGEDHVCQIITFGTLGAKAAVRDVGRALAMPLQEVDRIAKKIPTRDPQASNPVHVRLARALEMEPELKKEYQSDPRVKELFDISMKLEGVTRHASTHAAGVVISDKPITERIPIFSQNGVDSSAFSMDAVGELGMLKMDFLGLQTLTVMDKCVKLIERVHGVRVDLTALPLDDAKTYALLQEGRTRGVFQLESSGMTELVIRLKPDSFDDIIALLALFRPGPLQSGMVDQYVKCKHGEKITYLHPLLEPILKETYGVILYQEQVMRIANRLAGLSLPEADSLRKAMGKKKVEIMRKFQESFIEGCGTSGIPRPTAEAIWEQIVFFAGYGFNKSHSAAYAMVSWQTAWLKANYPVEMMAALMTCDRGNTDKVVEFRDECETLGIPVLPPDVNESELEMSVQDGRVRFGLGGIKGVGDRTVEAILAARAACGGRFKGLFQLCEHVDSKCLDRGTLEVMIRSGAFGSLGARRSQLLDVMERALRVGQQHQTDRRLGQGGLFGAVAAGQEPRLPETAELAEEELLKGEKETLGFYFSSHPLTKWRELVKAYSTCTVVAAAGIEDGTEVQIGGILTSVSPIVLKGGQNAGKKILRMKFRDFSGAMEATAFPKELEKFQDLLVEDRIVFLRGRVDRYRDEPGLRVSDVIPVENVREVCSQRVLIRLKDASDEHLERILATVTGAPGSCELFFEVTTGDGDRVTLATGSRFRFSPEPRIVARLEELAGPGGLVWRRRDMDGGPDPRKRWAPKSEAS